MTEPRRVVVTLPAIKSLTVLEIARASATAGVRRVDTERMLRTMVDPDADPADLERGALLLYAWAWQLVKREEPGTSWADAQTWRVEFDLTETDDEADAVAEATVNAAALTGLPPSEAGQLTIAEMGVYAELAERAGR
jgi:hypothetical protein